MREGWDEGRISCSRGLPRTIEQTKGLCKGRKPLAYTVVWSPVREMKKLKKYGRGEGDGKAKGRMSEGRDGEAWDDRRAGQAKHGMLEGRDK